MRDPSSARRRRPRWFTTIGLLLAALVFVAAACGNDDDDTSAEATATEAPTSEATDEPSESEDGAMADESEDDAMADEGASDDEAASGDLQTVRMAFNWVPDVEWAAWYLADDRGYFAEEGIEVEFVHGGPNTPAVVQTIAAGDADMGMAADMLEIITANREGGDFVALAAMYQRGPLGLTWLAETPIEGPEDLVGLRIGGPQGDQLQIEAVFRANDLPVDYTFVPMSFDPQPLVDGEMDAIASYVTNQPIQLELQGVETEAAPYSDFGLPSYGDIIFAEREWVEANPDVVTGFLTALLMGANDHIEDPMAVIPLLTDVYGVDTDINVEYAELGGPAYIALMDSEYTDANGLLSIDPERLENEVLPAIEATGETDLPPVDEIFDGSYLAEAHASMG